MIWHAIRVLIWLKISSTISNYLKKQGLKNVFKFKKMQMLLGLLGGIITYSIISRLFDRILQAIGYRPLDLVS